ncbi:S1 RNA-binding domain-containing protein [Streptomyces ipomoeae]|jgi:small subunit ribosomal protein S1|uniref:S1 RNA-binding domain-containing protein n=1 Tax=Streptomyces ipomoeae TaxID=103232 RepID=A0AAE8VX99_9ACTN|nr:S1 RNA-binding domain-containing protein [Streptomyces ipomoeae]
MRGLLRQPDEASQRADLRALGPTAPFPGIPVGPLDTELRGQAVLSLVALQPNPWSLWADRAGSVVRGRVTKLVPFGIFVRLDDGTTGLVHRSELPPAGREQAFRIGDEMTVRITEVDVLMRRIRLSLAGTDDVGAGSGTDAPLCRRP